MSEESQKGLFEEIRISVRGLVEFLCRSGDLDNRGGGTSVEVMQEGARIHRMLQREAGATYQAEVPLKLRCPVQGRENAFLQLEGRADGIYQGVNPDFPLLGECWTIDEIKSTYSPLKSLHEPVPVHLAQAKCYAYIYAVQEELESVRVRMTYYSVVTQETKCFYEDFTREEIEAWFQDLMEQFGKWARLELSWKETRTASMREMEFPFAYRPGQRELAVHVYHTICHGRKLFLQAPTGTGKTISVLFPALKAIGEGKADKLFYLTAKTVTGAAASDTLSLLRERGLRCKSVFLVAKDKACILDKPDCNPESCPRAKGHLDRVNDALYALLTREEDFSREIIARYAQEYEVCPFELSLDLSLFCDAVIGDYNYLFDPRAKLRRFFAGESAGPYLFLVDEAHNLVERGREMYSASMSLSALRSFRHKMKKPYPKLWKKAGPCVTQLRALSLQLPADEAETRNVRSNGVLKLEGAESVSELAEALGDLQDEIQFTLASQRREGAAALSQSRKEVQEDLLQFFFEMNHFLSMYAEMEDDYVTYVQGSAENPEIVLYCADPGRKLAGCMKAGIASILFSATFLPVQYYKHLLGGTEEDYEVCARSVFDPEKRGVFIARDVTTRYKERGPEQYERIAALIRGTVSQRHGNYMVFFPSYAFLEEVRSRYAERWPADEETDFAVQTPGMGEEERAAFLKRFEEVHDDRSLLGFCVLGGIFSEGIDLRRDRLIGVIVVGTGFPQVCTERELLKDYFGDPDGFSYAYTIPGLNKVLQAAGRVIRTVEDVGIVMLADARFSSGTYRRMLPQDWGRPETVDSESAAARVSRFWDEWL